MATNNITNTTAGNKQTILGAGVILGNRGSKTPTATQSDINGVDLSLGTVNKFARKSPAYIDRTESNPSGYNANGTENYGNGKIARVQGWKTDDGFFEHTVTFSNGSKPVYQTSNSVSQTGVVTFISSDLSTTWQVPGNCTSLTFEILGKGGNGGDTTSFNSGGGGGGGGAFVLSNNLTNRLNGQILTLTINSSTTKVFNGSTKIVEAGAGVNADLVVERTRWRSLYY